MKKVGFAIEVGVLVAVLGSFAVWKGEWMSKEIATGFVTERSTADNAGMENFVESSVEDVAENAGESVKSDIDEVSAEQETEEENLDPNSPAGRAEALGIPTPPEIDINSWEYVLVNGEHKLDASFAPEIGVALSMSSESNQDVRMVDALNTFAKAAENEGLDVYLSSGYRSYETQEMLFEMKCSEYDYDTAATIVAIPGTSEHQTGLCCDITDVYRNPKNSELENTETYKWMSAHCAEYGFIVRFPKGKEDITKIIYEPWHFRYVGVEAATYIMENDLTLEEFVSLYEA